MNNSERKSNNPSGRPKGSKNKATALTREFIGQFLNSNKRRLQRDWDLLEPFQRLQMFEKLSAFVVSKKSSVEIDKLSEPEVDFILKELINANEQSKQLQHSRN